MPSSVYDYTRTFCLQHLRLVPLDCEEIRAAIEKQNQKFTVGLISTLALPKGYKLNTYTNSETSILSLSSSMLVSQLYPVTLSSSPYLVTDEATELLWYENGVCHFGDKVLAGHEKLIIPKNEFSNLFFVLS